MNDNPDISVPARKAATTHVFRSQVIADLDRA